MSDEATPSFQEQASQLLSAYMQSTDDRTIDGFAAFLTASAGGDA